MSLKSESRQNLIRLNTQGGAQTKLLLYSVLTVCLVVASYGIAIASPASPLNPKAEIQPNGTAMVTWFHPNRCRDSREFYGQGPVQGIFVHDPGKGGVLAVQLVVTDRILLDSLNLYVSKVDDPSSLSAWSSARLACVAASDNRGVPGDALGDSIILTNFQGTWAQGGGWISAAWENPIEIDSSAWIEIIWPPSIDPVVELAWQFGTQQQPALVGVPEFEGTSFQPYPGGNPLLGLSCLSLCDQTQNLGMEPPAIGFHLVRTESVDGLIVSTQEVEIASDAPLLWHDTKVVVGHQYLYAIAAFDDFGNESDPCEMILSVPNRLGVELSTTTPLNITAHHEWVMAIACENPSGHSLIAAVDTVIELTCEDGDLPVACPGQIVYLIDQETPELPIEPGQSQLQLNLTGVPEQGSYIGAIECTICDTTMLLCDRHRLQFSLSVELQTSVFDEGDDNAQDIRNTVRVFVRNWNSDNDLTVYISSPTDSRDERGSRSGQSGIGDFTVSIYNILGQRMTRVPGQSFTNTATPISIHGSRHWARGVYLLRVSARAGQSTKKITKSQ